MNELDFIQTIKLQGTGYLLNGNMSVPMAEGNKEYELIKQWLAEGNTPEPEFTEEELALQAQAQARRLKQEALKVLTVTTASGKVFDADDIARLDMLGVIEASKVTGQTFTLWKLADNSFAEVGLEEMKEALLLSLLKKGEIIGIKERSL